MRPELETYQIIDRYLNKELQGEELLQFESKMASDPSLVQEVELMKMTNLVITSSSYDQLRKQMSADIQLRDRKASFSKKRVIGSSALLVVGVAACVYLATENVADREKNINTSALKPVVIDKEIEYASPHEKVADFSKEKVELPKQVESPIQEVSKKGVAKSTVEPLQRESETSLPTSSLPSPEPLMIEKETVKHGSDNSSNKVIVNEIPVNKPVHEKVESTQALTKEEAKPNRFTIHPSYGETWKVPANQDKMYVLTLHNSAGQLVFQHKSHDSHLSEWEGIGTSGNVLDAGLYIYVIEYQDGTREAGNITIAK